MDAARPREQQQKRGSGGKTMIECESAYEEVLLYDFEIGPRGALSKSAGCKVVWSALTNQSLERKHA